MIATAVVSPGYYKISTGCGLRLPCGVQEPTELSSLLEADGGFIIIPGRHALHAPAAATM